MLIMSLISCSDKTNKTEIEKENQKPNFDKSNIVERFFPENIKTEIRDSIIEYGNLKISVTKKSLKTFVVNEFSEENIKYIDKYRDNEIRLKITQESNVIIDTVFKKEDFKKYIDKPFMKIANFYDYWFEKTENGKFIFFGTISKPETDIAFDFNHHYDIKTKRFEVIEMKSEDE